MIKYNNNSSKTTVFSPQITTTQDGGRLYTLRTKSGDSEMLVYDIFPGIRLIYNSVHTGCCRLTPDGADRLITIRHCREGRIEQQSGGEFFYLMPGDLSISTFSKAHELYTFPLSHYHGITVTIDLDTAPHCLSCLLEDVNVQPALIAQNLCGEKGIFLLRSESCIEHIFSRLYSVPESYRKGYLKVKLLELLLVLSGIDTAKTPSARLALSGTQVLTAKKAAAFLAQSMDSRITVAQLAEKFHISQSHLQNAFKGVYGMPIYSYIRVLRMQSAAVQLVTSDASILHIAGSHGYDNAGKFSSAFRDIMGETPSEYRKRHR